MAEKKVGYERNLRWQPEFRCFFNLNYHIHLSTLVTSSSL
jgi:hypothetical protein